MWPASPACPADAADDLYAGARFWAVARAEARLERLCAYADLVEQQLGDDAMEEFLTDVTAMTGDGESAAVRRRTVPARTCSSW